MSHAHVLAGRGGPVAAFLLVLLALLLMATPTAIDEFFRRPATPPSSRPDSVAVAPPDTVRVADGVIAIRVDVETGRYVERAKPKGR